MTDNVTPPVTVGGMVLSTRLRRGWIKSELASAQEAREERRRREQRADEAHEAMVNLARETRAREDGISDPLAPEALCVSIGSVLDRERQAEARNHADAYDRWERERPTWLNRPPADHPIPEQTPSARVGRLLNRPLSEVEKLKIEQEIKQKRLRGE